MLLSAAASGRVKSVYSKYDKIRSHRGISGYDTVSRLLYANNVSGISIGRTGGTLSDHYHPSKGIVNLSDSTYNSTSIAAVAVAAHEMGHVMQKQNGYFFYKFRTALVPVVNICSKLSMPLVLVGLILDFTATVAIPDFGFYVAIFGVILYGSSLLFALITLPVELDASKRAREMLLSEGILMEDEIPAAKKVLSAAAMTYLVSLLVSLIYFLRFLLRVLMIFGRRRD